MSSRHSRRQPSADLDEQSQTIGSDGDLGSDEGPEAGLSGGPVEAGDARDTVAIGQGQGGHLEGGSRFDQLFGVAAGFEEGEGAARAELDIILGGGRSHD